MIQIIHGYETELFDDVMEKVWRFRHEQFVERLGWHDISQPDGRERDQFDTDQAIHLVLMQDHQVTGYSRLLPTTAPHLLSEVYPHLMGERSWPRNAATFEWTRCAAMRGKRSKDGAIFGNLVLTGVLEYCLMAQIEALVLETHPRLINLLLSNGWHVTPLGPPQNINNYPVLVIEAKPSLHALRCQRKNYGVNDRLIASTSQLVSPVTGGGLISIPPPGMEAMF